MTADPDDLLTPAEVEAELARYRLAHQADTEPAADPWPEEEPEPPAAPQDELKPRRKRRAARSKPTTPTPAADSALRPYLVGNPVDDFRWLRAEMGRGGLSSLFRRGEIVVHAPLIGEDGYVEPKRPEDYNGPAAIREITPKILVTLLALDYYVHSEREVNNTTVIRERFFPIDSAVHALNALETAPNLRILRGVTHTPMVRRDGSILDQPGYDDPSGFLYLPAAGLTVKPIPAAPSRQDVQAAVTLLRGLIDQFAWAGDHDEANFLGLLLTPLLRELCPPPYKLGGIMARQPGSGKSLLNRILREVHGGVFRSEMPPDDAELGKTISSILFCTTAPVVQFDNVSGTLRSSHLAGLLTSSTYSGRILGSTNNIDMVNDRLWTITGNNLNIGGDLVRRTLWVTIDPGCPDPHLRTGFRLDIPRYVAEHRGEILHALLVLVAAWDAASQPRQERSSDDYARWSSVVRGILTHAGIPGEFDHEDSAQQKVGTDDEGWGDFLAAAYRVFGTNVFVTRDLIDRMTQYRDSGGVPIDDSTARELVDALPSELHERYTRARQDPHAISRALGVWMKNRDGRWAGGYTCRKVGMDTNRNVPRWRVESYGQS